MGTVPAEKKTITFVIDKKGGATVYEESPLAAQLPQREKFSNAFAEQLAGHQFYVTNDPRFETIHQIALNQTEDVFRSFDNALRAYDSIIPFAPFASDKDHFSRVASLLLKMHHSWAEEIAVQIGLYEQMLNEPIQDSHLEQIGEHLVLLAHSKIPWNNRKYKHARTFTWENHSVRSSAAMEIVDVLIDKGERGSRKLSPEQLTRIFHET